MAKRADIPRIVPQGLAIKRGNTVGLYWKHLQRALQKVTSLRVLLNYFLFSGLLRRNYIKWAFQWERHFKALQIEINLERSLAQRLVCRIHRVT